MGWSVSEALGDAAAPVGISEFTPEGLATAGQGGFQGSGIGNPGGYVINQAGGFGGISDFAAGKDPMNAGQSHFQANPQYSNFASDPNFTQALAQQQQNAGMMFAPGANGAPSFAQGLMGNYNQAQGQQQNLINSLQGQATGMDPLSQNMLNQQMGMNSANAMGLAASQKGLNPAMAARMGGQNAAMANAQTGMQGMQHQLAAQGQLANVLGQNQGLNANMIGQSQGIGNQQYMQGQQLNQLTQAQNAANAQQAQTSNAQTAAANAQSRGSAMGGGMSGLGSILGAVLAAHGGKIPGASYFNGDDVRNDTVDAKLSPGEIVIPRSAAGDRDKAVRFLDALKSGDGSWKKKKGKKDE